MLVHMFRALSVVVGIVNARLTHLTILVEFPPPRNYAL